MREARRRGATVRCHDPLVTALAGAASWRSRPSCRGLRGVDAVVFAVPHAGYRELDLATLARTTTRPVVLDAQRRASAEASGRGCRAPAAASRASAGAGRVSRALITGGAGFIGARLARARSLERATRCDLVDNFSRGRARRGDRRAASARRCRAAVRARPAATRPRCADLGDDYDAGRPPRRDRRRRQRRSAARCRARRQRRDARTRARLAATRQRGSSRVLFASTSEVYAGTLETSGMPDSRRPRTARSTVRRLDRSAQRVHALEDLRRGDVPSRAACRSRSCGPTTSTARAWASRT